MEPEMPPRLQGFKNKQKTKAKATGRQCLLVTKD
ncbi:rCG46954 [Rattus norvegicus]|uniref:RCG46954 n=1 Tax=Rattus norvegicus TaxID=10116 RepID=A6IXI2_RAT|nr:rCG46954 [Rattus norvegicus]